MAASIKEKLATDAIAIRARGKRSREEEISRHIGTHVFRKGKIMGRIIVPVKIQNYRDLVLYGKESEQVRTIDTNALIDTGATKLCLTLELIEKLGFEQFEIVKVNTAEGVKEIKCYKYALVTIMGRETTTDVFEIKSNKVQPLVGHKILQDLDMVVDFSNDSVKFNPIGGDQLIYDLL